MSWISFYSTWLSINVVVFLHEDKAECTLQNNSNLTYGVKLTLLRDIFTDTFILTSIQCLLLGLHS